MDGTGRESELGNRGSFCIKAGEGGCSLKRAARVLTRQTLAGLTLLFVVAFAHQPGSKRRGLYQDTAAACLSHALDLLATLLTIFYTTNCCLIDSVGDVDSD